VGLGIYMSVQDFRGLIVENTEPRFCAKVMVDATNLISKTVSGPKTMVTTTSGARDSNLAVVSMKCLMRKYVDETILKANPQARREERL
jgi:hypothetical protein